MGGGIPTRISVLQGTWCVQPSCRRPSHTLESRPDYSSNVNGASGLSPCGWKSSLQRSAVPPDCSKGVPNFSSRAQCKVRFDRTKNLLSGPSAREELNQVLHLNFHSRDRRESLPPPRVKRETQQLVHFIFNFMFNIPPPLSHAY